MTFSEVESIGDLVEEYSYDIKTGNIANFYSAFFDSPHINIDDGNDWITLVEGVRKYAPKNLKERQVKQAVITVAGMYLFDAKCWLGRNVRWKKLSESLNEAYEDPKFYREFNDMFYCELARSKPELINF